MDITEDYRITLALDEFAFTQAPDPRFALDDVSTLAARDSIVYAIDKREAVVLVTAAPGSGKTSLLRGLQLHQHAHVMLLDGVRHRDANTVIYRLLACLDGQNVRSVRTARARLFELLEQRARRRQRLVLIVDNAHSMASSALTLLAALAQPQRPAARGTHRHGTGGAGLVLVGDSALSRRLRQRRFRELDALIQVRRVIRPLRAAETHALLVHRLRVAGAAPSVTGLFGEAVVDAIHDAARGNRGHICTLVDRALRAMKRSGALELTPAIIEAASQSVLSKVTPGFERRRRAAVGQRASDVMPLQPGTTVIRLVAAGLIWTSVTAIGTQAFGAPRATPLTPAQILAAPACPSQPISAPLGSPGMSADRAPDGVDGAGNG